MAQNPYLLAADNSPALLPLLRENPALASQQDEHGYSLVHAAASYNHLDLLRTLVRELAVPVDLRDEDGETALFVVETVPAARVLVEELGLDLALRGDDGVTARQKLEADDEFPEVVEYLRRKEAATNGAVNGESAGSSSSSSSSSAGLPRPPEGLSVTMGTMPDPETEDVPPPNPELRRRIEELARREDLSSAEGQAQLRQLVEEVLAGQSLAEERSVRPRRNE
ncbi:hypothetical protein RB595_007896 [Gaeumannomyces hyphopodioides]